MGKMGKFDAKGLKELQRELDQLQDTSDEFVQSCVKELAKRLLRLVIKRTPVGDYSGDSYTCASGQTHKGHKVPGKVGGTLRRGWTGEKRASAEAYTNSLAIRHEGGVYTIDIINPVEYASYVEKGHRTANHKGWVPGHFMLAISEQELESIAPQLLERKIEQYLGELQR